MFPLMDSYKVVLISFGALLLILNYFAVFLSLYHIRYQPFRAKQPLGLLVALIAATLSWVGNLQALNIVEPDGIFSVCSLWSVWVQFTFGLQLFVAVLLHRTLGLYLILVKKATRPFGVKFWLTQAIAYLPAIYCGLLIIIFPNRLQDNTSCEFRNDFYLGCIYASIGLELLILMVIMVNF